MTEPTVTLLRRATRIRESVLRMTNRGGAPFACSSLSIVDILTVLYGEVLHVDPEHPADPERDRLILSKSHAAAALYATLAEFGWYPVLDLDAHCGDGGNLAANVSHTAMPGVEVSIGAPGHGLTIGVGMAIAARADGRTHRVFVLAGDGDLATGGFWEAAALAGAQALSGLILVVDRNRISGSVRVDEASEALADRCRAFGWGVREVDGHDYRGLGRALGRLPVQGDRPSVVVCRTTKGAGVSFMEDRVDWHDRAPSLSELSRALSELKE